MADILLDGVVIENHGALFDVQVGDGIVRCFLRGRLKKDRQREVALIAAGDRVKLTLLERGRGVVEEVMPRESELARTAAGSEPLRQTLAANADQAIIVFAAAEPAADLFLLDRFLVAVVVAGLTPVVCINKCDLGRPDDLRRRLAAYDHAGFRVILASALRGDGVDELRGLLSDRRSVIIGPSGVGKSSLLNAVAPELGRQVGEVGGVTHKGRHTTTAVSLIRLPFGGAIADTPGVRQMHLWETAATDIRQGFPDLRPHLEACRFPDCAHRAEPGCGLRAAVDDGRADPRRARSFLEMGGR